MPDHDLLPDLDRRRCAGSATRRLTTSYLDDAGAARAGGRCCGRGWPFPAEQLTVVDGALDALDRITAAVVRFGDHVLVENPTFPPMLDLLESVGATVVGVPLDGSGIVPDALAAALARAPAGRALPAAAGAQPDRGQHDRRRGPPSSPRCCASIPDVIVVEDDHAGDIATAPAVSLGAAPARTGPCTCRSFSKSHGPDLRLAAVGGPADVIAAVADRRLLGPGWSSRLLQAVLLDLLTDPATVGAGRPRPGPSTPGAATLLLAALAARGVAGDRRRRDQPVDGGRRPAGGDGDAWPRTASRWRRARRSWSPPLAADHVRVTVGLVRDGFDELADLLAAAAGSVQRGSGPRTHAHPRGWR